jgi:hypothetical protein
MIGWRSAVDVGTGSAMGRLNGERLGRINA